MALSPRHPHGRASPDSRRDSDSVRRVSRGLAASDLPEDWEDCCPVEDPADGEEWVAPFPPAPPMSRLQRWAMGTSWRVWRLLAFLDPPKERQPKLLERRELEREMGAKVMRLVEQDPRIPRGAVIETRLRFHLGSNGVPKKIRVLTRDNPAVVKKAAIGYTKRMRFRPAAIDGRPVAVWVEIPLTIRTPAR